MIGLCRKRGVSNVARQKKPGNLIYETNVEPVDAIIGTGKISKRQYNISSERNVSIPVSDGSYY